MTLHPVIEEVTHELTQRSSKSRQNYLDLMQRARDDLPPKKRLSCGNLAHGYAACNEGDKKTIRLMQSANIGIITAYNDMLSAHQPFATYPDLIKQYANQLGSTAQVAGGVPAMCDGVTQGQPGMELSLFSRDVIAMATAVSLSHNLFDAALCLGVCDKIVPGLMIGALQFGHLPLVLLPAGPMPSGISNKEKASVRQRYAEGKATEEELLATESASYHSPGTCTFYGTANTNQTLMEVLGVQLPGASFINPEDPLRQAVIEQTVNSLVKAADPQHLTPLTDVVTPASIINALVALLATGGSTNHTLHLVAIARAAGIQLRWQDFEKVSQSVPLLVKIYPNGEEDVNSFQRAGGTAYLFRELRLGGLLNEDVKTIMGSGLSHYDLPPTLDDDKKFCWGEAIVESKRPEILGSIKQPFDHEGGIRLLQGNLGEGVIKISAVKPEHRFVKAPCIIFHDQLSMKIAFENGELEKDFIAVVRFQGPRANGMPELHQLTPFLGVLQDRGFKVALVTDGRMSGASGKVPAAIHLSPEALAHGPIAKLQDGDVIELDAEAGKLNVLIDADTLSTREVCEITTEELAYNHGTLGRNLFSAFRRTVSDASLGADVFNFDSGE